MSDQDVLIRQLQGRVNALAGPEAPTNATYQNGWTTQAGRVPAGFYKDRGRVFLRGFLNAQAATANPAFTLPVGYRPSGTVEMMISYIPGATSNYLDAVITILADGTVRIYPAPNSGAGTFSSDMRFVSLMGISFDLA